MTSLQTVLIFKIALTVAFWCVPLLFFPRWLLEQIGFPVPEPMIFLRLLGWAYVALVVGYGFGLAEVRRGRLPLAVIWVGVVSNGGAALLLAAHAASGTWSAWGTAAQINMWGSLVATGAITAGLVAEGLLQKNAVEHSNGNASSPQPG